MSCWSDRFFCLGPLQTPPILAKPWGKMSHTHKQVPKTQVGELKSLLSDVKGMMQKFPVPASEPERLYKVHETGVMGMTKDADGKPPPPSNHLWAVIKRTDSVVLPIPSYQEGALHVNTGGIFHPQCTPTAAACAIDFFIVSPRGRPLTRMRWT